MMPPMDLETHRPLLRSLTYRMLGSAPDADDVVQETFVRCLARPPDLDRPLRPWLVRVACNLARDRLRARRRRSYPGVWLPTPMPTEHIDPAPDPERRARLAQSATLAWLVAAERLTPEQRAVIVLRDVFDWSVEEVASLLDRSPGAIRGLHHRGRAALVDAPLPTPSPEVVARHRRALEGLIGAILSGDVELVGRLFHDDAVLLSDGGGEYFAAGKPIVGGSAVARLLLQLVSKAAPPTAVEIVELNGLPALHLRSDETRPRWAPRSVVAITTDEQGRIVRILNVLATAKLVAV
jgi:RNA polymerase sigma-70 factor (ECF subfamily)